MTADVIMRPILGGPGRSPPKRPAPVARPSARQGTSRGDVRPPQPGPPDVRPPPPPPGGGSSDLAPPGAGGLHRLMETAEGAVVVDGEAGCATFFVAHPPDGTPEG